MPKLKLIAKALVRSVSIFKKRLRELNIEAQSNIEPTICECCNNFFPKNELIKRRARLSDRWFMGVPYLYCKDCFWTDMFKLYSISIFISVIVIIFFCIFGEQFHRILLYAS